MWMACRPWARFPVDVDALGVDLYSMSGHKLYAPKGVGALYVRKGTRLAPVLFGGHHERDRRPGTENVPGVVAFGAAAELAGRNLAAESERLGALRDRLESAVLDRIPSAGVNGSRWNRAPNTSNIYFDGIDGEAMVIALDLRGFAVSTGAACSSRRHRAFPRADGHRALSRPGARQHALLPRPRQHRRTGGRAGGGARGLGGASAANFGPCLSFPSPSP